LNLGSLAELASTLRARTAASPLLADQAFRYSRLALAVVVSDIIRIIATVPINFPGVIASAAAVIGLYLIAFAQAAPAARRPRPGPRPVLLADQALGDPRLPLAVVVVNIIGVVPTVPRDFTRVELASAAVIGFDLITLAESIAASAIGIAAPAVKRRDEARLDARLALPIIIANVERAVRVNPRDLSWILLATTPARRNRPVNQGNCNFDAESVPVPRLYSCSNAHAAARRATTPGPAPAPAAPALLADQALRDARLALSIVVVNIICIVAAVTRDLALVEFAAAPIIGFDLVALAESITPAVRVAVPAAERRDEARFDARLGFAVVVCV
jgi:hypothetical protein